jgi:hypothetical protein
VIASVFLDKGGFEKVPEKRLAGYAETPLSHHCESGSPEGIEKTGFSLLRE